MILDFTIDWRPDVEAGRAVVTTICGQPVRIICWDRNNKNYPIVGLIGDSIMTWTAEGATYKDNHNPTDLRIVSPEEQDREFDIVYEWKGRAQESPCADGKLKWRRSPSYSNIMGDCLVRLCVKGEERYVLTPVLHEGDEYIPISELASLKTEE